MYKGAGQVILFAEVLDVVTSGCRATAAHLEDILDNLVDCYVRVSPDVVEKHQCIDVDVGFNREFSKQEVE